MSNFAVVTEFAIFTKGEPCFHVNNIPTTRVESYEASHDWTEIHFTDGQTVHIPNSRVRYITEYEGS